MKMKKKKKKTLDGIKGQGRPTEVAAKTGVRRENRACRNTTQRSLSFSFAHVFRQGSQNFTWGFWPLGAVMANYHHRHHKHHNHIPPPLEQASNTLHSTVPTRREPHDFPRTGSNSCHGIICMAWHAPDPSGTHLAT